MTGRSAVPFVGLPVGQLTGQILDQVVDWLVGLAVSSLLLVSRGGSANKVGVII